MIRVGNLSTPHLFSALPPVNISKASPKAISGRTSYIRVRLEFLRYPQVITDYFNRRVFGPPQRFTIASTCSWLGHSVSGLRHDTLHPIQIRFRFGFVSLTLNPHHIVTRRPVLQKVRYHTRMVLYLLVSSRFQVLFHSPPGVLFTFPSRYYSLSVTWSYLAFGDGPPFFRQDFSCPDVLRIPLSLSSVSSTGVSPSSLYLSRYFNY